MSQANGKNNYFNMVVSSSSRREVVRTNMDISLKKALDPVLKRWGYRDISKVTPQLRYYELELKSDTMAGDTAGMEVFIKTSDSTDRVLRGFHPFINRSSLKSFTQPYLQIDGWYLTRESSTGDGQLSLAVTCCQQLRHFKINFCPQEGYYKIASKSFENLHQLFSYYTDHPLKKTSEGVIYLLNPILGNQKVEDKPHEPVPTRPYPVSDAPKPQYNGGDPSPGNRPLPPLPPGGEIPHFAPPTVDPKPQLPSKESKNRIHSPESSSKHTDLTSRPLPDIPPPSDESPQSSIKQKPSKPDIRSKNPNPNSIKALSAHQLVPSFPDKPKNHVATLPVSPQVSPMTPITHNQNNNCDNSPPPPLPRTDPKPSFKATPSPTSNPVDANLATRGDTQGLKKNNSFKMQNCIPSDISPTPQTDNLPLPWKQVYSNTQKKYYFYNTETCVTSWKHPLVSKDSFSNSKQECTAKRPTNSVSSTDLSGRGPVRQRSQSSITGHRPERKTASPDKSDLFTAINVAEHADSNSQRKEFNKAPPNHHNHSESLPKPKSKQLLANMPQRNESPYDTLPANSAPPPSNQPNQSNPFPVQLKPIKVSKRLDSPRGSGKFSDPVSKSPSKPSPIPNSAPTGKPVKFGKHSIPAPPPNIPSAFSHETTPNCKSSSNSKYLTLPNRNTNSTRNGLIDSIHKFQPNQLRSVTPDRAPPTPVDNGNNILAVLKIRLEQRSERIQDSDQSDSSYEDADADW